MVATATGKYCVGDVLMSGDLWVNRDRLRLAKPRQITRENDNSAETDLSLSSPQSNATNDSNSRRSFVERTLSFSGISLGSTPPRSSRSFSQSENQPCTIM